MEFDILNELLTSTVCDLFTHSESVVYESKLKVKQLEVLQKTQNNRRSGSKDSRASGVSESSQDANRSTITEPKVLPKVKNIQQWMQLQAPRRLKQSLGNLGVEQAMLRNKKSDLEKYIESMNSEKLTLEKKRVKNELRSYDNDFAQLFGNLPNHQQKEPFRPLYIYYKKLKEHLSKRGVQQLSQEAIEKIIQNIKTERRDLREKIETYQKEFEETNNRKIRYVRDIHPIEYEYKRYKDLKNELQKYQQMLKNQQGQ